MPKMVRIIALDEDGDEVYRADLRVDAGTCYPDSSDMSEALCWAADALADERETEEN